MLILATAFLLLFAFLNIAVIGVLVRIAKALESIGGEDN